MLYEKENWEREREREREKRKKPAPKEKHRNINSDTTTHPSHLHTIYEGYKLIKVTQVLQENRHRTSLLWIWSQQHGENWPVDYKYYNKALIYGSKLENKKNTNIKKNPNHPPPYNTQRMHIMYRLWDSNTFRKDRYGYHLSFSESITESKWWNNSNRVMKTMRSRATISISH